MLVEWEIGHTFLSDQEHEARANFTLLAGGRTLRSVTRRKTHVSVPLLIIIAQSLNLT